MDSAGQNEAFVGQNETYVGHRLLYHRAGSVETRLMGHVSGEHAMAILRRAVGGAVILLLIMVLLSTLIGDSALLEILMSLLPIAWIVTHLIFPRNEILSDWSLLLDGKAAIADTAYGVIYQSLQVEHNIPAMIMPYRLRVGPPVRGVRNMLRVQIGKYYVFISVFAFGNDLYLGWTLWRRRLPVAVLGRWLVRYLQGDHGYRGLIDLEPVKAMREVVHNGLRQGIEAAVAGQQIPMGETFGYEVPIQDYDSGTPGSVGQPEKLTVAYPTQVLSADGLSSLGQVGPGAVYELIGDDAAGLVVRDSSGVIGIIPDRDSVRRE